MEAGKTLGERLKSLRRAQKLSQIEVAVEIGISRSHLAEIEGGKDPGFRTFCDLADFFGVSLDYLYRGSTAVGDDIAKSGADEGERDLLTFWRTLSDNEKSAVRLILMREKTVGVA